MLEKTKDLNNLPANEKGLCINISELNILQAKRSKITKIVIQLLRINLSMKV